VVSTDEMQLYALLFDGLKIMSSIDSLKYLESKGNEQVIMDDG